MEKPYAIAKYLMDKEYPDAHGEGDMAAQDGGGHTFQREIQRRRPPAEVLHGLLSFQEAYGEREIGRAHV